MAQILLILQATNAKYVDLNSGFVDVVVYDIVVAVHVVVGVEVRTPPDTVVASAAEVGASGIALAAWQGGKAVLILAVPAFFCFQILTSCFQATHIGYQIIPVRITW